MRVGSVVGACGVCNGRVVIIDAGVGRRPDEGECEQCGASYGVPKPSESEPPPAVAATASAPPPEAEQRPLGEDDIPF